jgi:hypothetical protein
MTYITPLTDSNGFHYSEEEITNPSLWPTTKKGTLKRLTIINPTETKKFDVSILGRELVESESGRQGLIAYLDYCIDGTSDQYDINIVYLYVHEEYRNKNILSTLILLVEESTPDGCTLDYGNIYSSTVLDKLVVSTARDGKIHTKYNPTIVED